MQKILTVNTYRQKAEKYHRLFSDEKKSLLFLSVLRLIVFAVGVFLSVAVLSFSVPAGIAVILFSVSLFLFLVSRFVHHSGKKEFFENLENINLNEIKALSGDLSAFNNGGKWINYDHDFSHDIDLFGDDSLFQFMNRTVTGHGREKLAEWLSDPYTISRELGLRQEAIAELSAKIDWRQEFLAKGTGKSLEKEDIDKLLEWLKDKTGFRLSHVMRILIWVLPAITILSILLLIAGLLPYQVFTILFIFNLLIILAMARVTGKIHDQVTKKHAFLSSFSSLLSAFGKEPFKSSLLDGIKKDISSPGSSAVLNLNKLSRIIQSFDTRLNLLVGLILNGLLMWDMHCIRSLEDWKEESKTNFQDWLGKIGEIDALISLASFAFNNPSYSYPGLSDDETIFSANGLGHPLITDGTRVCNDFCVSLKGNVFIVTGANMSGKSTFLRTVAVNFILAMVGAPVCASELKFKPVKLFTSMRTTDSLSHNESYFYAELKRLKILKMRLEAKDKVFFILDEILKGTNSADKSAGSKQFMRKIIELGGTGLIATHDTSLCDLEIEFPGNIFNKCFEIETDGEKLLFDFKLTDGITRKMNAALLMKQMGIA